MDNTIIETEEQYITVMDTIKELWDCPINSNEADLLEMLSVLVEDYEKKYHTL